MNADFQSIRDIFLAIVEQPASEWESLLDRACRNDPELRPQLAPLLKAHAAGQGILDQSLADRVTEGVGKSVSERPGTIIGPYKLLEQVGEGGFGVVFMAEQMQPLRRKVAVKVLKPGMDTRHVVARFEAERQALALMDHANIAHVLDGGETASGRPYFVMELVRGIPITDYCDQNQLPVRERLELFVTVCQAVQHAHHKGIIHRDLKPSNIMVTMYDDKPVVKVIDFGIAKATGQQLTDKTLFTNFAQMIGTPLYMSPEQARMSGLDVDTRTDIYSLGVLLYELLTGTTPFDQSRLKTAAYDEVLRIIREEEPPRPSTRVSALGQTAVTVSAYRKSDPKRLSQLFRGEVDWIVMKSLEKDRNRRYETATGLARDVERYLKDEPVLACPPSAAYRFRKFARRNKAPLTTAVLLLTALLTGTAASVWQAVEATIAKNEATESRIAESDAKQRAQEIAAKATKDLEQLNLANSFLESARTHFNHLGSDWAGADREYKRAVDSRKNSSHVWTERAEFYLRLGLWEFAGEDLGKAFELREPALAFYYYHLALLRLYVGDTNGYRQVCKRAEQRFAGTRDPQTCHYLVCAYQLSTDPADPVVDPARLCAMAETALAGHRRWWRVENVGMAHYRAGNYQQALEFIGNAKPVNWDLEDTVRIQAAFAMAYHRLERPDLARQSLDAAAKALDQLIETMFQKNQAGFLPNRYWFDLLSAELRFREAKALIEAKPLPADPRLSVIRGRALAAIGHQADAAASFTKALDLKPSLSEALIGRALAYRRLAHWDKAKADYMKAVTLAPKDAGLHNELAWLLATCPEARLRDPKEAIAVAEKAIAIKPENPDYRRTLGVARYRAEDWRGAVTELAKAVDIREASDGLLLPPGPFDCLYLGMALWRLGQKEPARQWFAHAAQRVKNTPGTDEELRLCEEAAALGLAAEGNTAPAVLKGVVLYSLILESDPEADWAYERRGIILAEQGQWHRAAADFSKLVELGSADVTAWWYCGFLHLRAGDTAGHRKLCTAMQERFGRTKDAWAAHTVAWTCVLGPEATADFLPVLELAEKNVARHPKNYWYPICLGAARYRAGQFQAAIQQLEARNAEARDENEPHTCLFLAMAHHRLGHAEAATRWLAKATRWIEQAPTQRPPVDWHYVVQVQIVHQEAERLVKEPAHNPPAGKPPATK
jgi:serine/threonine protein kinase/uncharacterized protein HemY